MMRVIIPNFKNFDNVAICPSDLGMDLFYVMTGGSGLYIDFSRISTGGVTCMEYLPGYMYVFYSNSDNKRSGETYCTQFSFCCHWTLFMINVLENV